MYEGEWFQGKKHGRGISTHQIGAVKYEGQFVDDKEDGFGFLDD